MVDIARLATSADLVKPISKGNSPVTPIRTVTVTMSPMLRDLVVGLVAGQASLNVVRELATRDGLEEQLQSLSPELILIGLGRNEGDEIRGDSLIRLLPNAKVIAFASDGRSAFVHRMRAQRTALHDVSSQMLIDAIMES